RSPILEPSLFPDLPASGRLLSPFAFAGFAPRRIGISYLSTGVTRRFMARPPAASPRGSLSGEANVGAPGSPGAENSFPDPPLRGPRGHAKVRVMPNTPSAPSLEGRTVLITGAAGGIGAATARRLGAAGARLVLADLDGGAVEK